MTEPIQHPFPAVEEWINELQSAEKDFREVLEFVEGGDQGGLIGYTRYLECIRQAREVLAKHPAMKMET